MQFKLVRPIFSAKRKKNPPVSALGVFYISISGTMKNKLIFPLKKNLIHLFSLFPFFFFQLTLFQCLLTGMYCFGTSGFSIKWTNPGARLEPY